MLYPFLKLSIIFIIKGLLQVTLTISTTIFVLATIFASHRTDPYSVSMTPIILILANEIDAIIHLLCPVPYLFIIFPLSPAAFIKRKLNLTNSMLFILMPFSNYFLAIIKNHNAYSFCLTLLIEIATKNP